MKKILLVALSILIICGGLILLFRFNDKQSTSIKLKKRDNVSLKAKEPVKTFKDYSENNDNSLLDISTISKNRKDKVETIILKLKNKSIYNYFVVSINYKQNENIVSKTSMDVQLDKDEEKKYIFKTLLTQVTDDYSVTIDYIKE